MAQSQSQMVMFGGTHDPKEIKARTKGRAASLVCLTKNLFLVCCIEEFGEKLQSYAERNQYIVKAAIPSLAPLVCFNVHMDRNELKQWLGTAFPDMQVLEYE